VGIVCRVKTVGAWAESSVCMCVCIIGYSDSLAANGVGVRAASAAGREVCCYIIRKSSKFASREREREREDKTMRV